MVVAQLVKQLLPTPEVRGSNPANGSLYIEYLLSTVLKRQNKVKRGPILRKTLLKHLGYCWN